MAYADSIKAVVSKGWALSVYRTGKPLQTELVVEVRKDTTSRHGCQRIVSLEQMDATTGDLVEQAIDECVAEFGCNPQAMLPQG